MSPLSWKISGFLVFSLLFISIPTYGQVSFSDVIQDAVTHQKTSDELAMTASFKPNFGFTLSEAAAMGGYDHFNWIQMITAYPSPFGAFCLSPYSSLPAVDPNIGGCNLPSHPADSKPFYWDEENVPGLDSGYLLSSNIGKNAEGQEISLHFFDSPMNSFIPFFGESMAFETFLVGVYSDDTFNILSMFTWTSNYGLFGGPDLVRNIYPQSGGTGGVSDAQDASIEELSIDERMLLSQYGAQNIPAIPEPSIHASLILGMAILFFTIKHAKNSGRRTFRKNRKR